MNKSRVEEVQKECDIKIGYTNYEEMLEKNKFDIVSICTPIQAHYSIVKKCIETGVKTIFCEKTLSYSLEEAEGMKKLCKEKNIVFGVNYILRWDSLNKEIKKMLENDAIGKIYTMTAYGATALHTSTSHLIDLMVYFANSKTEWIIGEIQKDFVRNVHGVEDFGGVGTVKFNSGIIGFIKGVSTSPFKYMLELDILGEKGRIILYNNGLSFDLYQYSKNINTAGKNYEDLVSLTSKAPKNDTILKINLGVIHDLSSKPNINSYALVNQIITISRSMLMTPRIKNKLYHIKLNAQQLDLVEKGLEDILFFKKKIEKDEKI